jgi:Tol biopolymer transport system component
VNVEYRSAGWGRRIWPVVSAALVATLAVVAVPAIRHWRERPAPADPPLRAAWTPPRALELGAGPEHPFGLAIAPDGRRLAVTAASDGHVALWLHDLESGRIEMVPDTGSAVSPFWSPDSRRVGFFARGAVWSWSLETSEPSRIADAPAAFGGSWNRAGDLLFAPDTRGGIRWRRADGAIDAVTSLDTARGDTAHAFPMFLDDGEGFVYLVRSSAPARQGVWLSSIADRSRAVRLTPSEASGIVAGGRLLFASDAALLARRIDRRAATLVGPAVVVGVGVGTGPDGALSATASAGTLLYAPSRPSTRELVWMTRDGARGETVGGRGEIWSARASPDGRRVVATVLSPQLRTLDVVLFEGADPVPHQLSLSADADELPAWSPDGLRVAWTSKRQSVVVRGAGAQLPEEVVARFDGPALVSSWTPDGRGIVVTRRSDQTRDDIWIVPLLGGEARRVIATPFSDVQGSVAPDGRWMAYASDESGAYEVYVERIMDRSPGPTTRIRVSSGGGSDPQWRRDGTELFFRRGSEIHAATLAFGRGQPEVVSTSTLIDTERDVRSFDVLPDGRRFLLNLDRSAPGLPAITLVAHWMGSR